MRNLPHNDITKDIVNYSLEVAMKSLVLCVGLLLSCVACNNTNIDTGIIFETIPGVVENQRLASVCEARKLAERPVSR